MNLTRERIVDSFSKIVLRVGGSYWSYRVIFDTLMRFTYIKKSNRSIYRLRLKNLNKKRYLVYSIDERCGLMSVACQILSFVPRLERENITLIVDWEYIDNLLSGKYSFWENIFSNPVSLEKALNTENVIKCRYGNKTDLVDDEWCRKKNRGNKNGLLYLSMENGRDYYKELNVYAKKYWKFNEDFSSFVKKCDESVNFKGKRVLGVMLREVFTEEKKQKFDDRIKEFLDLHPTNPSLEETIELIEIKMREWSCDYLYVSTYYEDSISAIRNRFGNKMLSSNRTRRNTNNQVGNSLDMYIDSNSFDLNRKKTNEDVDVNDLYKKDREYMYDIITLSKCDCFIGATCSGTLGTLILNGGDFEKWIILDDSNNNSVVNSRNLNEKK